MPNRFRFLLLACSVTALVRADPVALTNAEASRLFISARSTQSGLTAVNAIRLAQDINLLRPTAEAFEQKRTELSTRAQALATAPDRDLQLAKLTAELNAASGDKQVVDLRLITLSEQEITDSKIMPDALAEFLRFLDPASRKKK